MVYITAPLRGLAAWHALGKSPSNEWLSCCDAQEGGGLFAQGGQVTLTWGTLVHINSATARAHIDPPATSNPPSPKVALCVANTFTVAQGMGANVQVNAGEVVYRLPAPPGYWLSSGKCEVYRDSCGTSDREEDKAC